ncbi:MAG: small multi-drug export protein [Chloroflexota bacterium]|nr:MAG: hypothetical protein DIU68_06500 [Chloroflexota bacterium]
MLDNLPALAGVFTIAFVSLWASIPAGMAFGLNIAPVVLAASLAYAAGVAIVVLPGEPVRRWLLWRLGDRARLNPDSLVGRAWSRYGLIGLAFLAPVTTGAQIGALIGLALNTPPLRLFFWMALGGLLWTVALAAAVLFGVWGAGGGAHIF